MNHRFEHACWAQTDGTSPLEHGHASVACLKTSCRLPISICTVLREMATRSKSARITRTSCQVEPTSGGTDRGHVPLELWPKFCGSPSAVPTIIQMFKKRILRYGPELVYMYIYVYAACICTYMPKAGPSWTQRTNTLLIYARTHARPRPQAHTRAHAHVYKHTYVCICMCLNV